MKTIKFNKLSCVTHRNGLITIAPVRIKSPKMSAKKLKQFRDEARKLGRQYRKALNENRNRITQ